MVLGRALVFSPIIIRHHKRICCPVSVPGSSDSEWLDAISTIETGFSKAVSFVAKVKGIKNREFMLFPDVVDRVLKADFKEASE